jgi:xylulokinase
MYDFDHGRWTHAWMTDLQLDTIRLPVLHAAGEVVGQVHGAAAQATGLPQGLEVLCGLGDAAATTLGAGMTHASQSYAYLGTSGWVATLAQDFHRGDMPLFLLPYPEPGWHIRIGPISNAGSVHRWALQFTLKETEAQAYAELESLVTSTATDPDVVFLPYLSPERLPVMTDKPQGSFVGLSLQTTRADMLRAVLEGVALSLYWACEEVQTTTAETLLVVGGATRSAAWMQILADVWNKPVIAHPDSTYLACLGAAATAAVNLGWAASTSVFLEAASQATAQCCRPNPDQVERLAAKSQAFRQLQKQLSRAYG